MAPYTCTRNYQSAEHDPAFTGLLPAYAWLFVSEKGGMESRTKNDKKTIVGLTFFCLCFGHCQTGHSACCAAPAKQVPTASPPTSRPAVSRVTPESPLPACRSSSPSLGHSLLWLVWVVIEESCWSSTELACRRGVSVRCAASPYIRVCKAAGDGDRRARFSS